MTMKSSAMMRIDHRGKAVMTPVWRMALAPANHTAIHRAHSFMASSPAPAKTKRAPRTRWIHPQAANVQAMTPRPPTATSSLSVVAANPHRTFSVPMMSNATAAETVQPLDSGFDLVGEGLDLGGPASAAIARSLLPSPAFMQGTTIR